MGRPLSLNLAPNFESNGSFSMLSSDVSSPIVEGPPESLVPRGTRGFAAGAVSAMVVVKLGSWGEGSLGKLRKSGREEFVGSREREGAGTAPTSPCWTTPMVGAKVGGELQLC